MESINIECQVFTPHNIVVEILNQVGYIEKLYGKKVLENSCGDGAFLVEIVDRYIIDCLKQNFSKDRIIYGLENDIYGNEIDKKHKVNCIDNLNRIAKKYNIDCVKWNIVQNDFLKSSISEKFDFIIGNPPYITYSDLNKTTRSFIKKNFIVCLDGKPDYYYAFIEMSIKALADDGKLAYLIPNNIFKNRFADRLRIFMLPHLSVIIDYTTENLAWLQSKYHITGTVRSLEQADGMTHQWPKAQQLDAVVCETYLGQPFSAPPSPKKLHEVTGNCNHIITNFLRNIHSQLTPGTTLCIAVPAWRDASRNLTHLPLIKDLETLGYILQQPPLIYSRSDQVVVREILLLKTA